MSSDAVPRPGEASFASWQECNQRYLVAALRRIQRRLESVAHPSQDAAPPLADEQYEAAVAMPAPAALEELCVRLSLTEFERDLLLLCAGVELDASFAACCASAHLGHPPYVTFGLAIAVIPDAHWSALCPAATLRQVGLIEVEEKQSLNESRLRLDERVLHHLLGINYLDANLQPLMNRVAPAGTQPLPAAHTELAERLARLFADAASRSPEGTEASWPLVQLHGADALGRQAVCAAACATLGLTLFDLRAADVPVAAGERDRLRRLWSREVALGMAALLISMEEGDSPESLRAALTLSERVAGVVMLSGPVPLPLPRQRTLLRFELGQPGAREQTALWLQALGPLTPPESGQLEHLVSHFSLSPHGIRTASTDALARLAVDTTQTGLTQHLWDACRVTARARLDDLAQRIEPAADYSDLVLPEAQLQTLREIATQRRHQATVYERWGFAQKGLRGLGITVLFTGSSGTGKTLAAEVLAHDLKLDLYRVDLSQVVSKYIGETEKNLRRVFDAAEEGGAILLFDEADALFGKRSEVKDSHDRHANIEVSYLLQRMEAYKGLSILTSNLKSALDTAFLRRLRFIVQFPFPDIEQRRAIWQRMFPKETPLAGFDPAKLARLNVAGGHIRNIALNAAFLAAAAGEPVRMQDLLRATRSECLKMEKPLTEAEIGDWV